MTNFAEGCWKISGARTLEKSDAAGVGQTRGLRRPLRPPGGAEGPAQPERLPDATSRNLQQVPCAEGDGKHSCVPRRYSCRHSRPECPRLLSLLRRTHVLTWRDELNFRGRFLSSLRAG